MKFSFKNWDKFLLSLPVVKEAVAWTKANSFPGFKGVPIFDTLVFVYNEVTRFDLFTRANSIAFSFFLALFPALIVLFTLVPFFSEYILSFFDLTLSDFLTSLQVQIQRVLPGEEGIGSQLYRTIERFATQPRGGLLSFSFFLAIFFASNGMISMMRSFEKSHLTVYRKRNLIQTYGIAFLLTIQLGLISIVSVVTMILGERLIFWIGGFHDFEQVNTFGVALLRWLVTLSLVYFSIGVLYRYGASLSRKISIFSPGTALATLLSVVASLGFSFYVNEFGRYDQLYGSIGAVMVLMLWIQLNALALLIGYELNTSIAMNRDLKKRVESRQ